MTYYEYLNTDRWREKRAKRIEIDGYQCRFCGSRENLHVHHITYERVYNEDIEHDLITLCVSCHMQLHNAIDEEHEYINELYKEWADEANAVLKPIAEKYIDAQVRHLVHVATPFVVRNGFKRKPTILRVVEDAMGYHAGKSLGKNYAWYNTGSKSIYTEAMKRLPSSKKKNKEAQ